MSLTAVDESLKDTTLQGSLTSLRTGHSRNYISLFNAMNTVADNSMLT